jgi:hypothetical protein
MTSERPQPKHNERWQSRSAAATGTPSPIARALQCAVAVAQSREQRERVGAFVGGGARPGAGRGLRWPGLALARGDGELVAVELAEVVGEHRQPPLGSD